VRRFRVKRARGVTPAPAPV